MLTKLIEDEEDENEATAVANTEIIAVNGKSNMATGNYIENQEAKTIQHQIEEATQLRKSDSEQTKPIIVKQRRNHIANCYAAACSWGERRTATADPQWHG